MDNGDSDGEVIESVILRYSVARFFSRPFFLPKAKRSVGNKRSGLDMLGPKFRYGVNIFDASII